MIDINNLVQVDFKVISAVGTIGAYPTTVYMTNNLPDGWEPRVYKSLKEILEDVDLGLSGELPSVSDIDLEPEQVFAINAKIYFDNGGRDLLVIKPSGKTSDTFEADIAICRKLVNDFIYVVIGNDVKLTVGETVDIANWISNLPAPYTVRLCITNGDAKAGTSEDILMPKLSKYDVFVKYNTITDADGNLVDAALAMCAFISQIDLDGSNTIVDYSFTSEYIWVDTENLGAMDISQAQYQGLIDNNYNFISSIGASVINFGGNLANGVAITTDFGAISIENDVIYSLLNSLLKKRMLTESGLALMVGNISSCMTRYIGNGFLHAGAQYSGESVKLNYNGINFNVIEKGTTLLDGYQIFYVPIANILANDRAKKKFPPIIVTMETITGARMISVTGDVLG